LLKHTQRIIIPLVKITVSLPENRGVWLHNTNNQRKVHELQKWILKLTEITDILTRVNQVPGCTLPCRENHPQVMYLKVKILPDPMEDQDPLYSTISLVLCVLTV
jgi:hypothetical protein